jgi:hypothetical protein
MDTNEHQDYPSDDDDKFEWQRPIVRQSLDEIANEVGIEMHRLGLIFPIAMAVQGSGPLMTLMTPNDPTDEEWSATSAIVCQTIAKGLNGMRLCAWELACAVTNAPMTAAEIIPNELFFEFSS